LRRSQCIPRTALHRLELLNKYGNSNEARADRRITTAREEFKQIGLKAFLRNPLEDESLRPIMGPFTIYERLPCDDLHLVSSPNTLRPRPESLQTPCNLCTLSRIPCMFQQKKEGVDLRAIKWLYPLILLEHGTQKAAANGAVHVRTNSKVAEVEQLVIHRCAT
jgi:hypothetical protein